MNDNDQLTLIILGGLLLTSGAIAAIWGNILNALVGSGVLAPASTNPMITIPGANGAGLDINRLFMVAGTLVALAVFIWRARTTKKEK